MSETKLSSSTWLPASAFIAAVGIAFAVGVKVAGLDGRVDTGEKDRASIRAEVQREHSAIRADAQRDQANTQARMAAVEVKIDAMAKDVTDVAATLRAQAADFVTSQKMRAWRRKLAKDNPTILIPEWDD